MTSSSEIIILALMFLPKLDDSNPVFLGPQLKLNPGDLKNSLNPPPKEFEFPNGLGLSYAVFFWGSPKVSYASEISLNFVSADASFPALSGWYFIAKFL